MEKYAARELKQRINKVLWKVWDPIGVNDEPTTEDEYDSYVNPVFESLVGGDSDEVIANKLLDIVHNRMELRGATIADMLPTVKALRELKPPE